MKKMGNVLLFWLESWWKQDFIHININIWSEYALITLQNIIMMNQGVCPPLNYRKPVTKYWKKEVQIIRLIQTREYLHHYNYKRIIFYLTLDRGCSAWTLRSPYNLQTNETAMMCRANLTLATAQFTSSLVGICTEIIKHRVNWGKNAHGVKTPAWLFWAGFQKWQGEFSNEINF